MAASYRSYIYGANIGIPWEYGFHSRILVDSFVHQSPDAREV